MENKSNMIKTSWFGYKIGLENQLNFIDITNDEPDNV